MESKSFSEAALACGVLYTRAEELVNLISTLDEPKDAVWAKDAIMKVVHSLNAAYFDYADKAWRAQLDRDQEEE